jgi:GNAT superfamily N-acetyltransferase
MALLDEYLRLPDAWDGHPPADLPEPHRSLVARFPGAASPPTGEVLLVETNGAIIGQVLIVRHRPEVARLERMYVIEQARREGVGSLLIEHALQVACSIGYLQVVLDVIAERAGARRLYERFGFSPVEPYADHGRPMVFLGRSTEPLDGRKGL